MQRKREIGETVSLGWGQALGAVSVTSHAASVAGRLGLSPLTDDPFVLLAVGRVVFTGV